MPVYPVIMCGGAGTRLWPASVPQRPKQFLSLTGELSMFQETVRRVAAIPGTAQVVVVAGQGHGALVAEQLAALDTAAVVLLEPQARDSAPAMAAACAWIESCDPQGIAVVVAADHHIPDAAAFQRAAEQAVAAAQAGHIVTLGVTPREPSTAYGYISPGEPLDGEARRVAAFVEKPDAATAQGYIDQGYLWNSGNFVVSARGLLAELEAFEPQIATSARAAVAEAADGERSGARVLGRAFGQAPKISIDYAVMEKTRRAAVLPVDFDWSDLGAWDAVHAAGQADAQGNVTQGRTALIGAAGNLVRAGGRATVALVGVRDLAVVVEDDQILVCALDQSQQVKAAVDAVRALGPAPRFASQDAAARWFDNWLRTAALPLWWTIGADHVAGGFREALSPEGRPVAAPRRSRVQTRQTFVYATAGLMGWEGPWRDAAWHGMTYFLDRYRRPDGLFRALVSEAGEPLDETAALYDQAFALLAMATLHQADPGHVDLAGEGARLLQALQALRHEAGGFREAGAHPFQANAHMHLLEAALAWMEAGGSPEWRALAAEIVELALTRFIDPAGGFLREFFDDTWAPAAGDEGRIVEPGHQFEWAWLLARWGEMTGEPRARPAAERLYAAGLRGVDAVRGVAMNMLNDDFTVRAAAARLWPQTEWLKAALILGEEPLPPAQALARYLDTPAPGVWLDVWWLDGTFKPEPAPASSFYHIAAACQALALVQGAHSAPA
ncbi:MAG: AGE family epimerase/isomerase [Pseudomonadota bacterium]